jgi:hypothetical protein
MEVAGSSGQMPGTNGGAAVQSSFRLSLFTLFLALFAQLSPSQTVPLTNPAKADVALPPPQHFVCNTGYTLQQCHQQMAVLRPLLDKYGAGHLGEWTWVLVRSQDWKTIQRPWMDPDSPAFTVLGRRETFFEEALVSPVTLRRIELVRRWSLGTEDLLALAVTHELGHALCNEVDEWKADTYGQHLRRGESIHCR